MTMMPTPPAQGNAPSPRGGRVRVAAVADIHYGKDSHGALLNLFARATAEADVLVIAGDLTNYGLAEEARVLAKDLTTGLRIPAVGVLGNHDIESGEEREIASILGDAGLHLLDGDAYEVHGVGFAGVKGFAGGFGRGALGAWGEGAIKAFVHEVIAEALKLESALARLRTEARIAVLHYAPIRETVEGEPVEIFPWLGSSRLEEPLTRFNVTAAVHGHAHKGKPEGRTAGGIPVYNVALPLMQSHEPQGPGFRVLEVDVTPKDPADNRRSGGRRATDS